MCDTLFHTRLEWDDHKLSSDHLRKVGEQRRQFNPDLKDDEFELLDVIVIKDPEPAEEIPVASIPDMLNDQEIKEEDEEDERDEQAVQKEPEDNKDMKMETAGEVDKNKEADDKEANDVKDETTAVTEEIAANVTPTEEKPVVVKKEKEEKYNPANVVGRELVVKTGGHVCRICAMFMKNDEEAELHCQTASHYINFTSITKLHVSKICFFIVCT